MGFSNAPNATAAVDVILAPAVVYTQGFESNATGWTAGFSRVTSGTAHGGAYVISASPGGAGGGGVLWNGATGLIVGRSYTLTMWVKRSAGSGSFGVGLPFAVGAQTAVSTSWVLVSFTFVATATTQAFHYAYTTAGTYLLDDVTLTVNNPLGTQTLKIDGGALTMDKGVVPFVKGSVTVPLLSELLVEQLDPYSNMRVAIAADAGASPRAFDLVMTERTVNHKDRTIDVGLATDEALLMRYSKLTDDSTPRTHEANLRNLINYVLGVVIPGKTLESGTATADQTARWPITNLVANPSGEANANGVVASNWSVGQYVNGSITAVTMGSPTAVSGTRAVGWTSLAGGDSNIIPVGSAGGTTYSITPGRWYVWSFYIVSSAARTARAAIQWWSANGTVLSSQVFGATLPNTSGTFQRVSVIAQAPVGTSHAYPYVNVPSSAVATHYVDAAMFYEGNELVPYFDGDTADSSIYTYDWSNVAHGSTSTRTPLVERRPELFTWKAGVTAWDFLEPFVGSAKLRLWCDEQRRWYLVDPLTYTVPGRLIAQVTNTAEGTDTIDASSPELAPTGVIARFTWTDANGDSQTKDDTSGVNGRVLVYEFERPYPGPGTAALILQRFAGQGRVQDVTVGTDYAVTPGMEIGIVLPGTAYQLGTLQSVRWNLTEGVMDVGSANLVATPAGAINLLGGTIDALAGTINALS